MSAGKGRKFSVAFSPRSSTQTEAGKKTQPSQPAAANLTATNSQIEQSGLSSTKNTKVALPDEPRTEVVRRLSQIGPAVRHLQALDLILEASQAQQEPNLHHFATPVAQICSKLKLDAAQQQHVAGPSTGDKSSKLVPESQRRDTSKSGFSREQYLAAMRRSDSTWNIASRRVVDWASSLDRQLHSPPVQRKVKTRALDTDRQMIAQEAYDELNRQMPRGISQESSIKAFRFSTPPIAPILSVNYSRTEETDLMWLPPEVANSQAHLEHEQSRKNDVPAQKSPSTSAIESERQQATQAAALDRSAYLSRQGPPIPAKRRLQRATNRIVEHIRKLRQASGGSFEAVSPHQVMESIQHAVLEAETETVLSSGATVGVLFSDSERESDDESPLKFFSEPSSPTHTAYSPGNSIFSQSETKMDSTSHKWLLSSTELLLDVAHRLLVSQESTLRLKCMQLHWESCRNVALSAIALKESERRPKPSICQQLRRTWLSELQAATKSNLTQLAAGNAWINPAIISSLMADCPHHNEPQKQLPQVVFALADTSSGQDLLEEWFDIELLRIKITLQQLLETSKALQDSFLDLQRTVWVAETPTGSTGGLSSFERERHLGMSSLQESDVSSILSVQPDDHEYLLESMDSRYKLLTRDLRDSLLEDQKDAETRLANEVAANRELQLQISQTSQEWEQRKLMLLETRGEAATLFANARLTSAGLDQAAAAAAGEAGAALVSAVGSNDFASGTDLASILMDESKSADLIAEAKAERLERASRQAAAAVQLAYEGKIQKVQEQTHSVIAREHEVFLKHKARADARLAQSWSVQADELLSTSQERKATMAKLQERIEEVDKRSTQLREVCSGVSELEALKASIALLLVTRLAY